MQVYYHFSDLGGLGADEMLNEVVKDPANLVLVVRFLEQNDIDNGFANIQVVTINIYLGTAAASS